MIFKIFALFFPDDINSENTKRLHVIIQALSVGCYPVQFKLLPYLRHCKSMFVISLLGHDTEKIIQFKFLIGTLGHFFTSHSILGSEGFRKMCIQILIQFITFALWIHSPNMRAVFNNIERLVTGNEKSCALGCGQIFHL